MKFSLVVQTVELVSDTSRYAHLWQGAKPLSRPTKTTSEPSKMVRTCCVFSVLIPNMYFIAQWRALFHISISKSGLKCLAHCGFFHLQTRFAPQRRPLWHRNFQKCSTPDVFRVFWFAPQRRSVFHLSSDQIAGARRFGECTVWPSRAINHWKNTVFRDFSTFSRTCIFFLLTPSLLWSSLFFASLLFSYSFHFCVSLSILSDFWLLNFLRTCNTYITYRTYMPYIPYVTYTTCVNTQQT